jgi:hypothetical protein
LQRDPLGAPESRLVCTDKSKRQPRLAGHLLHQGRLADLSPAAHDLDETAGLEESSQEDPSLIPLKLFAHCAE